MSHLNVSQQMNDESRCSCKQSSITFLASRARDKPESYVAV